jgi:thymidine phosphorylase
MISLFLYLSVIITPDGQVKAFSDVVQECPTSEYVIQHHQAMVDAGDIVDWRASCNKHSFDMTVPEKGIST